MLCSSSDVYNFELEIYVRDFLGKKKNSIWALVQSMYDVPKNQIWPLDWLDGAEQRTNIWVVPQATQPIW